MPVQTTFKRVELKYMVDPAQKAAIMAGAADRLQPDAFGPVSIRNIYFDTDNYRLIRSSIEKPVYKEKLRLRSYGPAEPDSDIFVELKKKYKSVVYKRRLALSQREAESCFMENRPLPAESQIAREIDYFRSFYGQLSPAVFLSYDREAFLACDGSGLRLTFDRNILYRQHDMSLCAPAWGRELLPAGMTLMEIKVSGAMPLWLAELLSRQHVYKSSFSKYGAAYMDIFRCQEGGLLYA